MNHKVLARKAYKMVGSQTAFAQLLGPPYRQSHVTAWATGRKPVMPHHAHDIEKALKGALLRVDFYPKLFGDIQERIPMRDRPKFSMPDKAA